jgi:hypothetical protein
MIEELQLNIQYLMIKQMPTQMPQVMKNYWPELQLYLVLVIHFQATKGIAPINLQPDISIS